MNSIHFGVFGQTDAGKTYFVKNFLLSKLKKVVILDRLDEYKTCVREENQFYDFYEFADCFLEDIEAGKQYIKKTYNPIDRNEKEFYEFMYKQKDFQLIVEEIALDMNKQKIKYEAIYDIACRGRHNNISLIYTSQRPAQIHNDLISSTRVLVTFRQTGRADLDFFNYYLEKDGVVAIRKLKQGRKKIILGRENYLKIMNNRFF